MTGGPARQNSPEPETVNATWPDVDRRKPDCPERRTLPRGGRRISDLPHQVTCPNCGESQGVRGLAHGRNIRWCQCRTCGEIWPRAVDL